MQTENSGFTCGVKAGRSLQVWQEGDSPGRPPVNTHFTQDDTIFRLENFCFGRGVAGCPGEPSRVRASRSRGPPAAGVAGRRPRLRICSQARKPVPLEPISPVRNALRPRPRRRRRARHNTAGTGRPGPGSGRLPRSAPARQAARAGRAELDRGLKPRGRRRPRPRAELERGRLSRGISDSISVPRRGAKAAAAPSAGGRKRAPPLPSRSPA